MMTLTHKGKIFNADVARIFHSAHLRRQNKIIKHFAPKIFKVIKGDILSFIKAINDQGYSYAKAHLSVIVKVDSIIPVLKELYLRCAYIEGNFVLNYMKANKKNVSSEIQLKRITPHGGFGLGFADLASVIDSYFKIRLISDSALPITETTRKIILRHLIAEVDGGKDLAQALADFTDLALTGGHPKALRRALMIAQTETTKAMSFGGLIGAYMSGIDAEKVWVTSEDERVRGADPRYYAPFPHNEIDLFAADLFSFFYNGEAIKFPGDPDASIENIANCRCAMYFREKSVSRSVVRRGLHNFLTDLAAGVPSAQLIGDD